MSKNTEPWYRFKVEINPSILEDCTVTFPTSPVGNKAGDIVHDYLLTCGMKLQADCQSEAIYTARCDRSLVASLEKLQTKFAAKGATIIYLEKARESDFVSREEFEQLKKLSTLAEQELTSVEKQLQQLLAKQKS